MRKLIEIKDPSTISSGSYKSLAIGQEALWSDSENTIFVDGAVEKMPGWENQVDKASPIRALEQAYVDGERRVYYATDDAVYKNAYGVEQALKTGITSNGYWSFVTWGNWLIATDDYNVPQVWKNTAGASMTALAGVDVARFRLLKKWQNHVMAYYGQTLAFSSESNPELWVANTDNSAGYLPIRDLDSDVVAAQPLGSAYAVYSADTMLVQQYLGRPNYFGFPGTPINGIGAVSDSGIIPANNRNYGLSRKGFFVTDGVGFESIGSPAINRWALANIDWDNARRVVGLHWESLEQVCWWFPCKDGTIRGLAYRYNAQNWAPLRAPVHAAAEQQVFDYPLIGADNSWGLLGKGLEAGAVPLEAFVQSFPANAGERERFKVWDLLRVDKEFAGTVEFRLGFSDAYEDEPEWTDWATLEVENWINGRQSVFMTFAFRANGTGSTFRVGAFSVHGEIGAYL